MDRRFNRARYDTDQTVAAFAAGLRDAVDLDAVRADLLAVVNRAVEPTHISVWIATSRPGPPTRARLSAGPSSGEGPPAAEGSASPTL